MAKDASLASIEDLEAFERALGKYNDSLLGSTQEMAGAVRTVSDAWDDKVQQAFMEKFAEALQGVKKMADLVEEHKTYVRSRIVKLEDYMNGR